MQRTARRCRVRHIQERRYVIMQYSAFITYRKFRCSPVAARKLDGLYAIRPETTSDIGARDADE